MKRFLSILSIVIIFCTVLVCLSGCQKWFGVGHSKGSRAYYKIEGKVTDKDGNPIADKEIVLVGLAYDTPAADLDFNVWPFDTLKTDAGGRYAFDDYEIVFNGIRATTLDYLNKISEGCPKLRGMLVIPLEWDKEYSEIPTLEFSGALDPDEDHYEFWGYSTVLMPELIIEN